MKRIKIIFYAVTGLLSLMLLGSAIGLYLFNTAEAKANFAELGFPTYLVIPLALAKIIGVIVLLGRFNEKLTEWAYAAFFFNFLLAASAHLASGVPSAAPAIVAILLLVTSYWLNQKISPNQK